MRMRDGSTHPVEHRARRRQPDQADVRRRIEREVPVAGARRACRRRGEATARRVMERAPSSTMSRTFSRLGRHRPERSMSMHRRSVLKALAALPAGFAAPAFAQTYPGPPDQADRALSRGRRDRCRRARRRRAHGEGARPADRDRQPARRRRDRRHQRGREGRSRRLHAADHDARASDQHHAAEEAALRFDRGLRAGRPDGHHQLHPGGASLVADHRSAVARRIPEGESRQGELRLRRNGKPDASRARAVQVADRRAGQPRALSRRGGGAERHDRRAAHVHAVGHADGRAAHPVGRACARWRRRRRSALRWCRRSRPRPKPACRSGRPIPAS